MKSVLISIKPKWCELIASGKKTIEVRKTRPKCDTPFKCYIYQTVGGRTNTVDILENNLGKVIGEFVCDRIDRIDVIDGSMMTYIQVNSKGDMFITQETCLDIDRLQQYFGNKSGFGWHISDLVIYDKPKELSEFAVADRETIRQCKYREQIHYAFTDTGYIKNGFYCEKKDDWCFGDCKRKALTRPPQSWCYVEEIEE